MRVLLIHQNFPGQFRPLARHLATRGDVAVLGIGRESAPGIENCRLVRYRLARAGATRLHPYLRQIESAVLHGQAVARVLQQLKRHGHHPDVIVAHPGWGETLYAKDVFPDVRLIHFSEWYYATYGADIGFDPEFPISLDDRARIRTRNALHALNLDICDAAVSPTDWQRSRHPEAYHDKIAVIHEGVEVASDALLRDSVAALKMPSGLVLKAGDPVLTYVARNLEPYRGFHVFMRALERLQRRNPRVQAVIVGGDDVSYGSRPKDARNWREKMLREVKLDASRTHFLGKLPYATYQNVLRISAVHTYLTYPFVLSWSMLEAMGSGCLLVASDTAPVRECVSHGVNGLLTPFFDIEGLATSIESALTLAPHDAQRLRAAARQTVVTRYSAEAGLKAYLKLIGLPADAPLRGDSITLPTRQAQRFPAEHVKP